MNKKRNLVPIHISKLKPYIAGKRIEEVKKEHNLSNIIKLSSNENPLGSSPLAIDSLTFSIGKGPYCSSFLPTNISITFY